jgi:cyclic dehypoxanthinyl futalosine synthase
MSGDLIELAMRADIVRAQLHRYRIVSYCVHRDEPAPASVAIRPRWQPGMTGVEYLRLVAQTRLESPVQNIEVDWRATGMKVAQLALRFGANDFGCVEGCEEDVRRIIREAGFVPKRRDSAYTSLALD